MIRQTKQSAAIEGVTVREMTMGEIRGYFRDLQQYAIRLNQALADAEREGKEPDLLNIEGVDPADRVLGDVLVRDLRAMSTVTDEQIADATPSQLRKLAQECRELNEDFFNLRRQTAALGAT